MRPAAMATASPVPRPPPQLLSLAAEWSPGNEAGNEACWGEGLGMRLAGVKDWE